MYIHICIYIYLYIYIGPSYILTELVGQPQPFDPPFGPPFGQDPNINDAERARLDAERTRLVTFDNQLFQLYPPPLLNSVQSWMGSCVLVNPGARKFMCEIVVSFDVVTDFFPPSQIMASGIFDLQNIFT
jgi:hypothetical protein